MDFIKTLKPKFYKYDTRGAYEEEDENGNLIFKPNDGSGREHKQHAGFVAQEVLESLKEFGMYNENIKKGEYFDRKRWPDKTLEDETIMHEDQWIIGGWEHHYNMKIDELIAPMIKAIQELSVKVEALENA